MTMHQTRPRCRTRLGGSWRSCSVSRSSTLNCAGSRVRGYGRNGFDHVNADAALMSQAVGRPVRVQWMRWDEHGWEPKGPAIIQDLGGGLDATGQITAWRHHMWIPTTGDTHLIAAELIGKPDVVGRTGQGRPNVTYAYTFPNADVACHGEGQVALLTAWLRSPAQFETTFAMESFIDELAAVTRQDPLAFRLAHLTDPRAIAVLKAAAETYGWKSQPAGAGRTAGGRLAKGKGCGVGQSRRCPRGDDRRPHRRSPERSDQGRAGGGCP